MRKLNITIQSQLKEFLDVNNEKLLEFSRGQFAAIKKRNLRVPVKLYQL